MEKCLDEGLELSYHFCNIDTISHQLNYGNLFLLLSFHHWTDNMQNTSLCTRAALDLSLPTE